MRMRRRSRSSAVTDPAGAPAGETQLPPELEARIAALERADRREDFDRLSWVWMILFGIVLPLALMLIGWQV
jgi:hypothetical protein